MHTFGQVSTMFLTATNLLAATILYLKIILHFCLLPPQSFFIF